MMIFPAPASIADRYFPKKFESLILTLPMYFNLLGDGFGLWYPINLMDDTNEFVLIKERMNFCKIVGMISACPSLLLILPYMINHIRPKNKKSESEKLEIEYKLEKIDESLGFLQSIKISLKDKVSIMNL